MLPTDPHHLRPDRDQLAHHDRAVLDGEDGPGGVGAVLAGLVIAAALVFSVWYFVTADPPDGAEPRPEGTEAPVEAPAIG